MQACGKPGRCGCCTPAPPAHGARAPRRRGQGSRARRAPWCARAPRPRPGAPTGSQSPAAAGVCVLMCVCAVALERGERRAPPPGCHVLPVAVSQQHGPTASAPLGCTGPTARGPPQLAQRAIMPQPCTPHHYHRTLSTSPSPSSRAMRCCALSITCSPAHNNACACAVSDGAHRHAQPPLSIWCPQRIKLRSALSMKAHAQQHGITLEQEDKKNKLESLIKGAKKRAARAHLPHCWGSLRAC